MVRIRRRDQVRKGVTAGIRSAVLSRAGNSASTGAVEEAARLLSELNQLESTWSTRATQGAR